MQAAPQNTKAWGEWLKLQLHDDPELIALADKCAQFVLAFKNSAVPRWITILGATGTGKTHCGRRIWNHMMARCDWHRCDFIHHEIYWPKFVSKLKAGESFDQLRDMLWWPVLFLDDVGADRDTSGFASDQLNMLLGSREKKWTIITSNLSLSQIGAIDPRISDRMIRQPNIFIEMNTKSHSLRVLHRLAQP